MNLLPAVVGQDGLSILGVKFPRPEHLRRDTLPENVICGFRPDTVSIVENGEGIAGTVEVIEPMGGETIANIATGHQKVTVLYRNRLPINEGEQIGLMPDFASMHLFDAESGERIASRPPCAKPSVPGETL